MTAMMVVMSGGERFCAVLVFPGSREHPHRDADDDCG
jgi:hypothetical protein